MVGEVLAVEKHPNADKLTVCKVKAGKETLQVVCGAPNVRVGMKAPLGWRRCGTKEIAARRPERGHAVLGARSRPVRRSFRSAGNRQRKAGSDARAALGLDDHVFTLKLTPNRADCLSVLGVAREVAALTGAS